MTYDILCDSRQEPGDSKWYVVTGPRTISWPYKQPPKAIMLMKRHPWPGQNDKQEHVLN